MIHLDIYTVRPLLSADLVYPLFLRPNLSTPNLYEIQSNLWDGNRTDKMSFKISNSD